MSALALNEMRLGVRAIDSQLVQLLGRRFRLVRKIAQVKRELNMPIVDPATEKKVIRNFVAAAVDAGMDHGFARRIAHLVIQESVDLQRSMQVGNGRKSPAVKVAVVGGGAMGAWFVRFFKSKGHFVTISDRDKRRARILSSKMRVRYTSNNIEAVRGSDIVVVATPVYVASNVIREILPALKKGALLIDICAVKSAITPALRLAEKQGVRTVSIHPMFGPLASSLHRRNVIVVKTGRHEQNLHTLKQMLEHANIIQAGPLDHDRQTSLTLALPHFLNMAFAMTLSRRNLSSLRKFAGRTFNLQMLLAETVASEVGTTTDIQIMNREFPRVLREFQRNVRLLAKTVSTRDRAKLITYCQRIRDELSSDPEFAESSEAFERACEAISAG